MPSVSPSNSAVQGRDSVATMIRKRYSARGQDLVKPFEKTDNSGSPKHCSMTTADATQTHHKETPLVLIREMAAGHSGYFQWRKGALFASYAPVEQSDLDTMQRVVNQRCHCHSQTPWRILELYQTSAYAAGPVSYGDISIFLNLIANFSAEQLYLFSDPVDSYTLEHHADWHRFKEEPFFLPLKLLYASHQRSALVQVLRWFSVPADVMAVYMDVIELTETQYGERRHGEMQAIYGWVSDLLQRCAVCESFRDNQKVQVQVSRHRYAVKLRVRHKDGRGSSWSFALVTRNSKEGAEFVSTLLNMRKVLGPVEKASIPGPDQIDISSHLLSTISVC